MTKFLDRAVTNTNWVLGELRVASKEAIQVRANFRANNFQSNMDPTSKPRISPSKFLDRAVTNTNWVLGELRVASKEAIQVRAKLRAMREQHTKLSGL